MTYYNRDNLFNYNPIQRGVQGNVGQQGATGARGDEWEFFSSKNYLPENTGYTNLPGLTLPPGLAWNGGVLVGDKIYCTGNTVCVVDTIGDTLYFPPGLNGIVGAYSGAVLGPNGKIYYVPAGASTICIIDPVGNTFDQTSLTGITTTSNAYIGGVLAPNGKIYCIPYNVDDVLVIDPDGNSYYYPPILTNIYPGGVNLYQGGVLGTNGKIYGIPFAAKYILEIDPNTDTGNTLISVNTSGYNNFVGGVLGPNGLIYCMPHGTVKFVGIIDPIGQTFYTSNQPGLTNLPYPNGMFFGGVLGQNGLIYCCPRANSGANSKTILVIDTINNVGYTNLPGLTNLFGSLNGGVLAANGSIYMISVSTTASPGILKIKTGLPKYPPWMLDPYFNKF